MPHYGPCWLKVRWAWFRKFGFVGQLPTQAPQCMHSMSSIAMMPLSRTEGRIETTCSGMAATPLLDRHRELLLDFLAEVRPRVVCAERDDFAVGRRVMDDTALDALDVVVVVVLEVHAADVHRRPGELRGTGLVALREHPVQDLQHLGEAHALGRLLGLEVPLEELQRLQLRGEL